jgi:tetratricopeptide (TPR) repeat protein
LLKNVSDNTVSDYYLGISYIETHQFLEAKNAFHKITQKENNLFTEQAEWYKGLCLLKLKELPEAIELFTSISMSSSIYNQNAKEILKELK